MKRWIERQEGVTADERLVYDVLKDEDLIWRYASPPYTLSLARRILTELDASRAGVIPDEKT